MSCLVPIGWSYLNGVRVLRVGLTSGFVLGQVLLGGVGSFIVKGLVVR